MEAGDRQPRSLSAAFRNAVKPDLSAAMVATRDHLAEMDRNYETGESRHALTLWNGEMPNAPRASIREIAAWAKAAVANGEAA